MSLSVAESVGWKDAIQVVSTALQKEVDMAVLMAVLKAETTVSHLVVGWEKERAFD